MPADFTCTVCGFAVHDMTADRPPEPPVCMVCTWIGEHAPGLKVGRDGRLVPREGHVS